MNWTKELISIARNAGKIILDIYHSDYEIENKSDDSPVTVADKKVNEYICQELKKLTPNIPIISEEEKNIDYEVRKEWQECWMVDPLDGTKEFINKNGEFTVNIALIKERQPHQSIVYVPVTDEIFVAIKGEGAFKVINQDFQKLHANNIKQTDEHLKIVCSRSHVNAATEDFISKFKNPEKVAIGSSLKFCRIAEGKADIYPRLGSTMEWDTAAAELILTESGGKVMTTDGKPMTYNKVDLLNPFFIAYANIEVEEFFTQRLDN